jgi:hypothetical protein
MGQSPVVLKAGGFGDAAKIGGPQSRSEFMSLLALILPASDLETLTVVEFNALIPILAGEVMSNPQIHMILRDRASEALRQLKMT